VKEGKLPLALVLISACAASTQQDTLEALKDAVEGYNHAFRWKDYERAALSVPPDLRRAFLAAYEDDESSLQIEDYEIAHVRLEGEDAATVTVRVRYMLLPAVIVQRATLVQHWHKIGADWILETEENSLRRLDPSREPENPRARDPEPVAPEQSGRTEVEVEGPE